MTDKKLDRWYLRYARKGDLTALARAFDRAAPEMARVARHLTSTEAEAEDIVQTAFLVAVERPDQFEAREGGHSFLPWMLGIVANRSRELRRQRARTPEPDRLPEREVADPVDQAADAEFLAHVDETVRDLPPLYADTVRAHLGEGLSPSEIARRFGISANTASVRIHRGLKLLRKALPAGFALGAAATTSSVGLAAVRREVLGRAALEVGKPLAVAPAPSLVATGGILVSTQLKLAFALLALLSAGLYWLNSDSDRRADVAAPEPRPVGELANVAPAAEGTLEPQLEPATVERTELGAERSGGGAWELAFRVADHETSRGLAGARIHERLADGTRALLATTDERGEARFRGTLELEACLYIDAPGYAPFRSPRRAEDRDESFAHTVSRQLDVEARRLSYWDVRLRRGARVAGRVVDADTGAPVVAAELFLFEGQLLGPVSVADEALAVTDGSGHFQLDGRVAWMTRRNTDYFLFAASAERIGWTKLGVLEGHEDVADAEIRLFPSQSLSVQVVTADGEPLEDVQVTCTPAMGPWVLTSMRTELCQGGLAPERFMEFFQGRTDSEGRGRFGGLPTQATSSVTVQVGKEWKPLFTHRVSFDAPGWRIDDRQVRMSMEGGTQLTVTAEPQRELQVVVRVLDHAGRPIEDATVRVASLESLETDGDGVARFPRVAAELFPLEITSVPDSSPLETRRVELPSEDEVRITVRHKEPVGLRVAVVDQFGAPYRDVSLGAEQGDVACIARGWDPEGYYDFPEASEGVWRVYARDRDYREVASGEFETGDEVHTLVVPRPAELPSARLEARLVDGETGAALSAARASLSALDEAARSVPLPEVERRAGELVVERLPLGSWMLEVWVEERAQGWHRIDVREPGELLRPTIEVHRRVDLTGSVDFGDLARPGAAFVTCSLDIAAFGAEADRRMTQRSMILWIDEQSGFRVGGLEPGPWTFTLVGDGVYCEPLAFEVEPQSAPHVELLARAAGKLVLQADEAFDDGFAELRTREPGGAWTTAGTSSTRDPDLRLWVSLPPGEVEYEVRFVPRGVTNERVDLARPVAGTATLRQGEETLVPIAIRRD